MPKSRATEPAPQSPYDRRVEPTPRNPEGNEARQRTADQDQVIQDCQRVVEATPDNHADRASRFYDLGLKLEDRYKRAGRIDDVNQAIEYYHQAVEATPDDHPDRAWLLQEAAASLGGRYHRTGQVDDLEQAIQYFQQAVKATKATPDKHQERARRFAGVGVGLHDRYKNTGQIDDIRQAIQCCRQAIDATPHDHPDRARRLQELGAGLRDLYQRTGQAADLQESAEAFRGSCLDRFGDPIIRINAGKQAARILVAEQKWEDSSHVLSHILQLLPRVTRPTDSREKWQQRLPTFSGLASETASVLLKTGMSPLTALQALESGRGIIANFMMDMRWDISKLQDIDLGLLQNYKLMGQQMAAFNAHDAPLTSAEQREHQQFTSKYLSELQSDIRQCPGFENFLLPPTEKELLDMAHDGPLVCFNVSNVSSEAFLVTTTGVHVLHLPNLKENDIQHGMTSFASRGNPARRDASLVESDDEEEEEEPSTLDPAKELLSLWKHAVRPVLDQLGLLGPKDPLHRLQRIWWVGGGSMALVPLHAAGEHTPGSTENTLSHVTSSYAASLKALQYSRSKPKPQFFIENSGLSEPEVAIMSMPITPEGHKSLQLAEEVKAIRDQSEAWATVTSLDRPGKESALNALKSCDIVHFACHATADPVEPTKSALLLGKDVLEKLTLEDIMNLDSFTHQHAQVAYLSACSTAEIKVRNLADESIHLASAFQLAGFMHVIGTLWAADDSAAVNIAGKFYEGLEIYDRELFDRDESGSVAYALHYAVLHYRSVPGNSTAVAKWGPFIHLGC